jgi:hypothetical protein
MVIHMSIIQKGRKKAKNSNFRWDTKSWTAREVKRQIIYNFTSDCGNGEYTLVYDFWTLKEDNNEMSKLSFEQIECIKIHLQEKFTKNY